MQRIRGEKMSERTTGKKFIKIRGANVNNLKNLSHAIPGSELKTSDERRMTAFRDRLNSLGVTCTIRRSRGEDIMAACGMLAGRKLKDNK